MTLKNNTSNEPRLENKSAINSNQSVVTIVMEAMKTAPWPAKVILGVQGITIILILAALVIFRSEPLYVFITIILVMIVSLFIIRSFLPYLQKPPPEIVWSREYIDNIKADAAFQKIEKELKRFTKKVCTIVSSQVRNYPARNIRTMIFIPHCGDAKDGYVFRLFIPTPLKCNMNHIPEWGIRFRPGVGNTGLCFNEGSMRITLKRDFMIDDEFRGSIHEDLKWIISIPLKNPKSHSLAVLSIDGLKQDIEINDLEEIAKKSEAEVKSVEKLLNQLPMTKMSVFRGRLSVPADR